MATHKLTLSHRLGGSLFMLALTAVVLACSAPQITLSSRASDRSASRMATPLPAPATDILVTTATGTQTAVFAGGCFWGMEAVFEHLKGVSDVVSGFAGDSAESAHYALVSSGQTEHAEAVKITYDPSQISYGRLLQIFFAVAHDPTQLNRQGPDSGPQYRSAIFFANPEQQRVAQAYMTQLNQAHVFNQAIATQLVPLNGFYAAESYHQNFIQHNPTYPYVVVHDLPKLEQLRAQFPNLYQN